MFNWFPIDSWQDLAAIFTIGSVPFVLGSLVAAFRQIKSQADTSRRELSFNGLIEFNSKFERTSDLFQSTRERIENSDKTVNYQTVKKVSNGYWRLVHEEFEFFRNGLVPVDIFTGWMLLSYGEIAGETNLKYFNKEGAIVEMNSRERFQSIILNGRYKHHPRFCMFFTGLYNLKARGSQELIIPDALRYETISKYIRTYVRENRIRPIA